VPRLIININLKELDALVNLALAELRNPRDQAHFLLRQKLHEQGLLDKHPSAITADTRSYQPLELEEGVSDG